MAVRGGKKKQRPHRPFDLGPRVYREEGSRWWKADLRPWGLSRLTLKDPDAPGWPARGVRTELEEVARKWAWEYLGTIHRNERRRVHRLGPEPRQLGQAIDDFLAHRRQTVEKATFINSRTAAVHLVEYFGRGMLTSKVEASDLQSIAEAMLEEGYEISSLELYVRTWRLFFEWAWFGICGQDLRENVNRRRLAEFYDPTEGIKLPKKGEVDVRTLSDSEIPELLKAARKVDATTSKRDWPSAVTACAIGLYMGLREGEIFALDGPAIDASEKMVRVNFQTQKDSTQLKPTKGKNARTALILPPYWQYHEPRIGIILGVGGRPLGSRPRRQMITRVLDTAGLKEIGNGWHLLRHTFSRLFLEGGGSMGQLQKSLGHSSIVTTETRYGHLHADVAARLARVELYGA